MDDHDKFSSPASSRNSNNPVILPGTTSSKRSQNSETHPGNFARSMSSWRETPYSSPSRSRSNNSDFQPSNSGRSNLDRNDSQEIFLTDDDDDSESDKKLTEAVLTRITKLRKLKNYHKGQIDGLTEEVDRIKQKISNTEELCRHFLSDLQVQWPELYHRWDEVDGHIDS